MPFSKTINSLPLGGQNASVSICTVEIAQLCEKRHDNVMTDVRKMFTELNLNAPDFSGTYKTAQGNEYSCFFLPKREAMILVSGYRIDLRAKIIDRLDELENQQFPKDYPSALRRLADEAEQKQLLKMTVMQVSAENTALKSYFEQGLTPPQFAKGLNGVNSNKINDYLRTKGWLYKDNKDNWRVFANARDKYLTESFKRVEIDPVLRIELTTYKPVLLEAGAIKIFEDYMKGKLPMKADWNGKYYHSKVAA